MGINPVEVRFLSAAQMDARREGKPGTKAPTEYGTAPVCFSGSNPDASIKYGPILLMVRRSDSQSENRDSSSRGATTFRKRLMTLASKTANHHKSAIKGYLTKMVG